MAQEWQTNEPWHWKPDKGMEGNAGPAGPLGAVHGGASLRSSGRRCVLDLKAAPYALNPAGSWGSYAVHDGVSDAVREFWMETE